MSDVFNLESKLSNPFRKKKNAKQPTAQKASQKPSRDTFEMGTVGKDTRKHDFSACDNPGSSMCIIGYKGTYLGFVPSFESVGQDCIYYCVEKILDGCNAREALMREAFVDIQTSCLRVHFVDDHMKVVQTKIYDLARISYCCSNHDNDPRIFSWIYRQEIDIGFQLECHAVRFATDKKASLVATQLYKSFNKMYSEVETAVSSSRSVLTKFKSKLTLQSDSEASSPSCSPKRHEGIMTKYGSPSKRAIQMVESGSFVDNMGFENIEEHCIGVEYESDNVFMES